MLRYFIGLINNDQGIGYQRRHDAFALPRSSNFACFDYGSCCGTFVDESHLSTCFILGFRKVVHFQNL